MPPPRLHWCADLLFLWCPIRSRYFVSATLLPVTCNVHAGCGVAISHKRLDSTRRAAYSISNGRLNRSQPPSFQASPFMARSLVVTRFESSFIRTKRMPIIKATSYKPPSPRPKTPSHLFLSPFDPRPSQVDPIRLSSPASAPLCFPSFRSGAVRKTPCP